MNSNNDKIIALYQKTRLQQPSGKLDDKVLAEANLQLKYRAKKPKQIIWALSSVAVLVLSVNVGLKLLLEPTATMAPPPAASFSPRLQQDGVAIQMDKAVAAKKMQQNILKQKSRSMKPEIMSSPAVFAEQKAMPELLEISDARPPVIPFNAINISKLNNAITASQKNSDEINVYAKQDLILTLRKLSDKRIKLTAYPQENELGFNINWSLKPKQLNACINDQCALNAVQTAYFKNDVLFKVSWIQ